MKINKDVQTYDIATAMLLLLHLINSIWVDFNLIYNIKLNIDIKLSIWNVTILSLKPKQMVYTVELNCGESKLFIPTNCQTVFVPNLRRIYFLF